MADSCTTCKFYSPVDPALGYAASGYCRYDPPVVDLTSEPGTVARFPVCLAVYWCGKFSAA